jgi:hypothetical protein
MYSGDDLYADDVTSGPIGYDDNDYSELDDDDLSGEFSDISQGRYDTE